MNARSTSAVPSIAMMAPIENVLVVEVCDRQGNVSRIVRTFALSANGS